MATRSMKSEVSRLRGNIPQPVNIKKSNFKQDLKKSMTASEILGNIKELQDPP